MATTKDKFTFVHAMARSTRATVRQCEALMRYAGTLADLAEWESEGDQVSWITRGTRKRLRIQRKVTELCGEPEMYMRRADGLKAQCVPLFAGPVLKIRTPGGEEITCPS